MFGHSGHSIGYQGLPRPLSTTAAGRCMLGPHYPVRLLAMIRCKPVMPLTVVQLHVVNLATWYELHPLC